MASPPRYPDSNSGYPGAPRWVKVFGMILGALILLVVVLRLTGVGGRHGPGRHLPSGEPAAQTAPSGTTEKPASAERGHTVPEGGH